MTVNVSRQTEARLFDVARREGIDPAALIEKMVREYQPSGTATVDDDARVSALLAQWQRETATETSPAIPAHELFARWAEEDSHMTDEEKEAEDRLWENFMEGVNETRAALGMRQL